MKKLFLALFLVLPLVTQGAVTLTNVPVSGLPLLSESDLDVAHSYLYIISTNPSNPTVYVSYQTLSRDLLSKVLGGSPDTPGETWYVTNIYVTNFFISTNITVTSNTVTIINTTNLIDNSVTWITNTIVNYNIVTNTYTNVYATYQTVTNVYKNSTIHYTNNTWITINGTNVVTINPTDGYLPYRSGTNSFGDSPILRIDDTTVGVEELDANAVVVTNLATGGVVISDTDGLVTNLFHGTGALTNDGAGNLGWYDYQTLISSSLPAVTNYFLEALSGNLTVETNVATTNVTWRVDVAGLLTNWAKLDTNIATPQAVTNYFLDVGSNMTVSTNVSGTNVTWTVRVNDPLYVTNNIGALLSAGDATFVDMLKASQTNEVSAAVTLAHATNGVTATELTHVCWLYNGSGSDQTLTINANWRTNVNSAVPPALTNNTLTAVYLKSLGATDTAAKQTNCLVSFEFYK